MRKINTQDVFKLARIIKKSDLHKSISGFISKGKSIKGKNAKANEEKQEELGIEVAFTLLDAVSNEQVENEFYSLLAGIAGKKPDEIKNQSIEDTLSMLIEIGKENNLINFFNMACRLMPK